MDTPLQALHAAKPVLLALALPPAPMLMLMLLSAGLLRRRRRLGWTLLLSAAAALWMACTEAGADLAGRVLLEEQFALSTAQVDKLKSAPATAILVLGGGASQEVPEYGGASLKSITLERLRYGIWLGRRTGLPVAYTGGVGWGGKTWDLAEGPLASQTAEQEFGLPLMFAEGRSRDTRENAAFSLPMLRERGIRHVVLVTHAPHMPRAIRAFSEAAGAEMDLTPAPVGTRADDAALTAGDWLPSNSGIVQTRYVIYEWLGLGLGR